MDAGIAEILSHMQDFQDWSTLCDLLKKYDVLRIRLTADADDIRKEFEMLEEARLEYRKAAIAVEKWRNFESQRIQAVYKQNKELQAKVKTLEAQLERSLMAWNPPTRRLYQSAE